MGSEIRVDHKQAQSGSTKPLVYNVDNFGDKQFIIDSYDWVPDISHGGLTSQFVKSECSNAEIKEIGAFKPITQEDLKAQKGMYENFYNNMSPQEEILFSEVLESLYKGSTNKHIDLSKQFKKIHEEMQKSNKPNAVTTAIGYFSNINSLAKATGLPLTNENLLEYKDEVRKWIDEHGGDGLLNYLDKAMDSIEEVTREGVPVYIAAGNYGKDNVNIFTFADGVTAVGALDKNGEKTSYSADNSLISEWNKGDYEVKELKNGYDFTEDNKEDILYKETSPGRQIKRLYAWMPVSKTEIRGTSFATPSFLGKTLKKQGLCGEEQ